MFEIERKFLVKKDQWQRAIDFTNYFKISQYYLNEEKTGTERRVRKTIEVQYNVEKTAVYYYTEKTDTIDASTRIEEEMIIPAEEALLLISHAISFLSKIRYKAPFDFEIDVYLEHNQGLVVAEKELQSIKENIFLPDYIGEEITGNKSFSNFQLARQI